MRSYISVLFLILFLFLISKLVRKIFSNPYQRQKKRRKTTKKSISSQTCLLKRILLRSLLCLENFYQTLGFFNQSVKMVPPYMIQLCNRVFNVDYNLVDADGESTAVLIGVCSNWFYQAYEHCSALLTKKPGCQKIWNKIMVLKRFIFPDNETSILSHEIPISIHPEFLSPNNCHELAHQIIKDYIHYVPRYMAVLNENQCLWLILRGVFGIIIVAACLYIVASRYNSFRNPKPQLKLLKEPLSMHQRLLNRNMKRVLYETRFLSVVPVIDPTLMKCGFPALALKIDARKFCDVQALLVRPHKRLNPSDSDNYQTQAAEKLQSFFSHSGKYRLVISLDLDNGDEETALKVNRGVLAKSSSGIPIHKPVPRIGIRRRLQ